MLQIQNICKTYRTGSLVQQALKNVSLNLRDSEFVAILGQSGSGKTTLLNIIGGLDRYDQGNLIINGVSTKEYRDRDWDSYRNHTVGFVFQSYNLIPHQTILANVELALTIGGISKKDRTRRATEALKKVGLEDHLHKRPSQLSGGQMQRVAIARALVNDPDILLADEPTGALDSETSLQVMDLLQEVARDRLVVMVTHNPELAERYATRIVNLRDGEILSDSDPYIPEVTAPAVHRNMGKASMSFLTALDLSFNNLRTKLARTILVAFAGSIGIIGIAMILSLSNGVDRYIGNVEEETLQGYPLQISDTSLDYSSMLGANMGVDNAEEESDSEEKAVREWSLVTSMLSQVTTNDLQSLKSYLETGDSGIDDCVRAIEYDYNLSPQIFSLGEDGTSVRQVNPDRSFAALGFSGAEGMNSLMTAWSSTDSFHPMPADESLFRDQYDVKAGRWPENWQECVLVLTERGRVTDMTLYAMGLKDPESLDEMIRSFAEGNEVEVEETEGRYDYEEFLGVTFKLVSSADYYVYDSAYEVWTDKSGDEKYMRTLAQQGDDLTVVGVVQPREDATAPILAMGIDYPWSLTEHLLGTACDSEIVQAQLENPDLNVFTGEAFGAETDRSDLDMGNLFSVDQEAIENAFSFEEGDLGELDVSDMDFSDLDVSDLDLSDLDLSQMQVDMPTVSQSDIASLLRSVKINISAEQMETLFRSLLEGYAAHSAQDPATDYAKLPQAIQEYLASGAAQTILQEDVQAILSQMAEAIVTREQIEGIVASVMAGYPAWLEAQDFGEQEPYAYVALYLGTEAAQAAVAEQAEALRGQLSGLTLTPEQLEGVTQDLIEGYRAYAEENGLPDVSRMGDSLTGYLDTPEAQQILAEGVNQAVDTSELERQAASMFNSYSAAMGNLMGSVMEQVVSAMTEAVTEGMTRSMETLMEEVSKNFTSAFQMDPEAMAEAFSMNFSGEELRDLMTSLLSTEETSFESNLRKLGYADPDKPATITIYPTDFEGKARVKAILEDYNEIQRQSGAEEKVITYTDVVDTLMSSVTDIINAISYVLIAFVAISLVVSSIMIGVITYISVLELNKEIGILRAIGASKRNISEVFNAETFIIGGLAGVLGVGITLLLLIPTNHIIHTLADMDNINAALPPRAAVILIVLSIILTLIGGIIPSRKAARSDPVAALRSE